MLKVIEILPVVEEAIEIDDYVPLTVEFSVGDSLPAYWRGKDGTTGLVEIGVSKRSGLLQSVTLTSLSQAEIVEPPLWLTAAKLLPGFPRCDVSIWAASDSDFSNRFVDEDAGLRLCFFDNSACLLLGADIECVRFLRSGRIGFGLDSEDRLAAVMVYGLSKDEENVLRSSLS